MDILLKEILNLSDNAERYIDYAISKAIEWCNEYFTADKLNPDELHISSMGQYYQSYKAAFYEILKTYNNVTVVRINKRKGYYYQGAKIVEIVDEWFEKNTINEQNNEFKSFFDPQNYNFTHAILDYANDIIKQNFPNKNLWMRCLDFDFMSISDIDKLPEVIKY